MSDVILKVPHPRISFAGKIYLVSSDLQLQEVATALIEASAFGFDTETKPTFKKGDVHKVALVQLATLDSAYMIRLHYITDFDLLKKIFENKAVVKVGVAIRDDLKSLQKIFKFEPKGFIELQDVAKEKGLKNFGLKGMTEEILEATISKGPKMSNWENPQLTEPQLLYAATDAWIGLSLYKKLLDRLPSAT